jgi:hypothetical protein
MFIISLRINWRAPTIACICYAQLRGPVFGRQVVNNYFYAQVVGSTLAVLTLLIAFNKSDKWKCSIVDLFVLISVRTTNRP